MDGTVREIAGGVELRLERHLAHPIEKVWAALTEPRRLSEWLAEGEMELRLGGRVYLKGDEIESTVTALDPPKLIQYGWKTAEWDGGQIRWELDPTQTGTRLVLTHVFTPPTDEERTNSAKRTTFRRDGIRCRALWPAGTRSSPTCRAPSTVRRGGRRCRVGKPWKAGRSKTSTTRRSSCASRS